MNRTAKTHLKTAAELCLVTCLWAWGPIACKPTVKEPAKKAASEPAVGTETSLPSPAPPVDPPATGETEQPSGPTAASAKIANPAPTAAPEGGPPPDDQPGLGVVLASKLNVRKSPTITPQSIAGSLRCGDLVNIQGKEGEWYQIDLKDELQGYAHSSYIVRVRPGGHSPKCEFSFARKKLAASGKEDKPLPTTAQRSKDSVEVKEGTAVPEAAAPSAPAASGAASVAKQPAGAGTAARPTPPRIEPTATQVAVPVDKGPSNIVLSGREDSAKPVKFPHQFHQKRYDCVKCHHPIAMTNGGISRAKIGEANTNKKCRSCHVPDGSPQVRPTSKDVFHLACRDCHNVVGGGAPTGCPQCHK